MKLRNAVTTILLCICCSLISISYAQESEKYCLAVMAEWNGTDWEEYLYLCTTRAYDPVLNGNPVSIRRQLEEEVPCSLRYVIGGDSIEIAWGDIKELQVHLSISPKGEVGSAKAYLMDINSLDFCNYDSIRSVKIDYSSFGMELDANSQLFDELKVASNLTEFRLTGKHAANFNLEYLAGLPLERLELSFTPGREILCFPHLKSLVLPTPFDGFNHYASLLPDETEVSGIYSGYYNRFNYLYAENYFNLVANDRILNEILKKFKSTHPDRWVEKGDISITIGDIKQFHMDSDKSKILAQGKLKKGKPVGVWTINNSGAWSMNDMPPFQVDMNQDLNLEENGPWTLEYIDGTTAVEGSFFNGQKTGYWNFYDNYGLLKCTRRYVRDTLKNTIVHFDMHGNLMESRAYYFNENQSIQTFQNEGEVLFMYHDAVQFNKNKMVISEASLSLLKEDGSYEVISRRDASFKEVMRREVIDLVYPEYRGQELPFEY